MPRESDTKERIERSALRLFVEQGIAETSIREIAQEAGVSQGAMYNHYASKEDLAWELFSSNFSEIGHELRRIAADCDTLASKLTGVVPREGEVVVLAPSADGRMEAVGRIGAD